jgi:arginase family enzyme
VGVLSLAKLLPDPLVYLYLDAHLDLGLHCETADMHNGNFVDALRCSEHIHQVVNVGVRSWTSCLPVYQEGTGIVAIPCGVRGLRMEEVVRVLGPLRGFPLYVSLDADVLDLMQVSCPEPFGMSPAELFALCEWLGDAFRVAGADVSELLPAEPSLGTEQVLLRCLHALFPRPGRRTAAPL